MADALQVSWLISGLVDNSGNRLASGTVTFFESDGVTIKTIWEDANKLTTSANPITLDAKGTSNVFADGIYSVTIKDVNGSIIETPSSLTFDTGLDTDIFGIDASTFGSGNDSDAISQAILSAGGSDATVYLKNQTWTIDVNLTIPTNINLRYFYGAFTTINSGITFTISGTVEAELFNIFRGPGTLALDDRNNDVPSIWLQGGVHDNRTLDGIVTVPDTLKVDIIDNNVGTEVKITDSLEVEELNGNITLDGRVAATSAALSTLNLIGAQTATGDFAKIDFTNYDAGGTAADVLSCQISAERNGVNSADLTFSTINATSLQEEMRIKADGKIGIGTASPTGEVHIFTQLAGTGITPNVNACELLIENNSNCGITIGTANIANIYFATDADDDIGRISYITGTNQLEFFTNAAKAIQITSAGDLEVFNNVSLDGTGAFETNTTATTDGVTLDNTGLKGFASSAETFSIVPTNGRVTSNESKITRTTIKITSTATVGTSINAAIATLGADGGIIYLPAGTYSLDTTITVTTGSITILGDGQQKTIIDNDFASTRMIDLQVGATDFVLDNIQLNGVGTSTAPTLLEQTATVNRSLFINCSFQGASTQQLSLDTNNTIIEKCIINIPASSKGIVHTGVFTTIKECCFDGVVATSIGIELSGIVTNLKVINNDFDTCDRCINFLSTATATQIWIKENTFTSCSLGVKQNATSTIEDVWIEKNLFSTCDDSAIDLDTVKNTHIISNNIIDQSSGTEGILVDKVITLDIIGNKIENCSFSTITSKAISIPSQLTTAETLLNISGNQITNCVADHGISTAGLNNVAARTSLTISGNIINQCTNMNRGISTTATRSIIESNKITDNTARAAINIDGILASGIRSIINNNLVSDLNANAAVIRGIGFGSDSVVNSNNVFISDSDGGNFDGIFETSATIGVISGNRVEVVNAGAGTGNAFSVSMTDGTAVGNTYNGSDALGTLTISAGIVANNDG